MADDSPDGIRTDITGQTTGLRASQPASQSTGAGAPARGVMSRSSVEFSELVDAYGKDLYRYAYWLSRDPSIAEDLVQETLLRAWKSFSKLQDVKAARSWLITTVRREHLRRFERYQPTTVDVDELEFLPAIPTDDIAAEDEIRQRMATLSVADREALLLQAGYGYTLKEIAEMTESTPAAVGNRVYRARQRLLASGAAASDAEAQHA